MNAGQFKVGNGAVRTAKALNISYDTLTSEDSGRTDSGVMKIYWVKGGADSIVKLEIEMPPMNKTDLTALLTDVQGKIYNITYLDLLTGSDRTVQVYTSTSKANCYSGIYNNNTGLWEGVSFNAIATGA